MNLDLDYELRLAVFDHVGRIVERSGVVTSRELNEGMLFHGERVPIWNQQKGIFRPRILRESGAALTIQTSFDSPYDDRAGGPNDEHLIYRYRGTDPSHPDNVALVRAMELGRPLLYLIAIEAGVYEAVYPCLVVDAQPERLAFLLIADAEGTIAAPMAAPDSDWPRKAYITRAVKMRLHQSRFRALVLRAYRRQCAMCRLRHVPLLDAAHILPDRDPRGNPEIPNGLALCRIHHRAYDVGIVGVDPEHVVHLRPDVLDEVDGPMLLHGLQELHGRGIQLPRRAADQPNRDYLAERFARFLAA